MVHSQSADKTLANIKQNAANIDKEDLPITNYLC